MFGDGTVQRGVEARRIVLPCVRGRRRRRSILRVTATIIDRPSYCLLDTRITLSPTIIVVTQPREQTSMQLLRIPWEWESRSHAHLCPQLDLKANGGQRTDKSGGREEGSWDYPSLPPTPGGPDAAAAVLAVLDVNAAVILTRRVTDDYSRCPPGGWCLVSGLVRGIVTLY